MVFLFEKPQKIEMWMKDTLIPLDVGFFDANGMLVKKHTMPVETDPSNPKKTYSSEKEITASLEVAPGSLKKYNVSKSYLCVEVVTSPQL